MTWIETIPRAAATGRLKTSYDRIAGKDGQIDNILAAHSLRPHTLDGHMALYKSVLHHGQNEVPLEHLEAIGVFVSLLNGCDYCVGHHLEGLRRLLGDDERLAAIREALEAGEPERAFAGKELAMLRYALVLTVEPTSVSRDTIADLRDKGLSDGEILEVNQVVSYFAYANRTVLGLGISADGEDLGLSPSDTGDPGNWSRR